MKIWGILIFWPSIICEKLSKCEILCEDRELSSWFLFAGGLGSPLQPWLGTWSSLCLCCCRCCPSMCWGSLLPSPAEGLLTPAQLSAGLDSLCMKRGTWGRTCMHWCRLCMAPRWDQGIQRPGNHPEIPEDRYSQHLSRPRGPKEGQPGGRVPKSGINRTAGLGKQQTLSCAPLGDQCLHCTILTTNTQQPWLCSHSMSKQIQSPVLYLLPAGTAPRCEESGKGNKLMAFSLSLTLPSVGGTDMICLGGSDSSFSGLVTLEADVPSKQSKGKKRINRENRVCL